MAAAVLSDTLQSITAIKINESEKRKEAFEAEKQHILSTANQAPRGSRERVEALLNGIKELPGSPSDGLEDELSNIRRWLEQAQYDPAFPSAKLFEYEEKLQAYLDHRSSKFQLASLYSKLITEWAQSRNSTESLKEKTDISGSEDAFEVVEDTQKARLEQLRDKFARVVFEPLQTDESAIDLFLHRLFDGDDGQSVLKKLREDISQYGKFIWERDYFFDNERDLRIIIQALLHNDLLNEETKVTLRDILKDEAVMVEVRDVLNLRIRHLGEWQWNAGGEGIRVRPQQSLNGKWRVKMDEDVLEAILTQAIGQHWAAKLKQAFVQTRRSAKLWKNQTTLPEEEQRKRQYYFEKKTFQSMTDVANVAVYRRDVYDNSFFLSPLPSSVYDEAMIGADYDGEDDGFQDQKGKSARTVKQLLLHTLATEVIFHKALDGEVVVVQSDFQWFATSVSHSTIFAIMRFVGFGEKWVDFFRKFLRPPLNMLDGEPVRQRQRGLPMAHIVEKTLGELMLYFMDLAVAQSGAMLYRFHDDLWLVGKPRQCAAAWRTMTEFAEVMGLEFNKTKTGSVYLTNDKRGRDPAVMKALPDGPVGMDFLILDPDSGSWIIKHEHVEKHVRQLQKQLGESKSVLQWIQTWNSCIGRFFSYTFGEPAHCFGQSHVDAILETHRAMQEALFRSEMGATVTEHLGSMLRERFGVGAVPPSFLYLPECLGGLGVKNPFVPLLLKRPNVCQDPECEMEAFFKEERAEYDEAKKLFTELTDRERHRRYTKAFVEDEYGEKAPLVSWKDAQTFISFEEFVRFRESTNSLLYKKYKYFLDQPSKAGMLPGSEEEIYRALVANFSPVEGSNLYHELEGDDEVMWALSFYREELFNKFEGLKVVDKRLVPMGVLQTLKSKKVTWNMVL